jgi:predicted acyl esterase
MKRRWLAGLVLAIGMANAVAQTFTTADTLIAVPDKADCTATGDTTPIGGGTINLDARVYIPDGVSAPAPVILIIPPYGGSKDSSLVITVAQDFAAQGYVVLTPTLRGFGNSDGLVTFAGPNEINDLKTIIVAMQNGTIGNSPAVPIPVSGASKFGVTGASYGGGQSFELLRTHVPGLAAAAPIIGWTDLYQALAPNSVPKFSFAVGLFASGFDAQNPNYDDLMFDRVRQLLSGDPEDMRTADCSSIDWRSVIFNPTELSVPVFVIQGWRDWLFPAEQAISLFQASTNIPLFKLYVGGLGHAPATADLSNDEAVYLRTQLIRWFDYWLKGIDNGIAAEPRITIAPEHTGNWSEQALITSNTFPLANTTPVTFALNGQTLSLTGSGGRASSVRPNSFGPAVFAPIQNALGNTNALVTAVAAANLVINQGADVLDPRVVTGLDDDANATGFTSAALPFDVHVIGIPQVNLTVSSTERDAYYYVQLVERLNDGTIRLVSRNAFKDTANGFRRAHPITFSLFGVNHVFKAGSKIRLRVASRDFPFFLPNLEQGTLKIYHGRRNPSSLVLPIVP